MKSNAYIVLVLVALSAAGTAVPAAAAPVQPAVRLPSSVVRFPGPARGTPGSQTPRAGDFRLSCNVGVNNDAMGMVAGTAVLTGTAIAGSSCGTASLLIDA